MQKSAKKNESDRKYHFVYSLSQDRDSQMIFHRVMIQDSVLKKCVIVNQNAYCIAYNILTDSNRHDGD